MLASTARSPGAGLRGAAGRATPLAQPPPAGCLSRMSGRPQLRPAERPGCCRHLACTLLRFRAARIARWRSAQTIGLLCCRRPGSHTIAVVWASGERHVPIPLTGLTERRMAGRSVQELVEICQCSVNRAQELLREADNDMATAIALHFADPTGLPTGPQSPRCAQSAAQLAPADRACEKISRSSALRSPSSRTGTACIGVNRSLIQLARAGDNCASSQRITPPEQDDSTHELHSSGPPPDPLARDREVR